MIALFVSLSRNKCVCGVLCIIKDDWLEVIEETINGLSPESEDSLTGLTN